jgi:hypothetical protein
MRSPFLAVASSHCSSRGGYELLGVFLRESCSSDFAGNGLGIVCDAFDRDLGVVCAGTQNGDTRHAGRRLSARLPSRS